MKRIVWMILFLTGICTSSLAYQTEYSYKTSTFGTTSGYIQQSNSSHRQPFSYPVQQNKIGYTTPYGGEYPSCGNGGRNGGPRRISVHNGNGGTEETPGGSSDHTDWLYQYDESTDTWWCSKDGGLTWFKWDSLFGFGLFGWDWRSGRGNPTDGATHYHNDPNNPWVVPIGDNYIWFMVCLSSIYIFVKTRKDESEYDNKPCSKEIF